MLINVSTEISVPWCLVIPLNVRIRNAFLGDVGCLGRDHGVSGHKVVRCGSTCFFGLGSVRVAQLWRIYYVWYRLKLTFSDALGTCAL